MQFHINAHCSITMCSFIQMVIWPRAAKNMVRVGSGIGGRPSGGLFHGEMAQGRGGEELAKGRGGEELATPAQYAKSFHEGRARGSRTDVDVDERKNKVIDRAARYRSD